MAMAVTAAIWLLFVTLSLWPPRGRSPLGTAIFIMTLTLNEIPLALLAVFAIAIMITARPEGSFATGMSVLLVAGAAGGLVWLQVRARTCRVALSTALEEELGGGWWVSPGTPDRASEPLTTTPWLRGILLPFQRRTRSVQRLRNLSYGPDRAHRFDCYRGPSTGRARPVLIHLHGGHFAQGNKSREGVALLNQLASHGWLCVSANYRLGRAGRHPNPLVDTKRLIGWIRRHAHELDADPADIFVVGSSAGGHLAISAGLTAGFADLQPGFEADDTSVAGVVVLYGYLGARTDSASSSPIRLARPDAPPMLIIHGARDTMVPPRETSMVADTLRSRSRCPVIFAELPHTQHSFDRFASVRARVVASGVEAFLDWARTASGRRAQLGRLERR